LPAAARKPRQNHRTTNLPGTILYIDVVRRDAGSFLEYAYSVIIRGIARARDGLKPVHRRILYQAAEMGLARTAATSSARASSVSDGQLHPT